MLLINRPEIRDRPCADDLVTRSDPRGYLEMFSLYRVIACLAVLGQHSFIWANMSGNFVGTGFITMLHLSRNSFFFLTGLVVCYAQITHPRSLGGLWKRRYSEIVVPYLAWTGIYLVFSLITVNASWNEAGAFLRHTVPLGFSQMYFIVVLFQFYLLFPLLLKLMRATRHHGMIMAASLAFAMVVGYAEHYPSRLLPVSNVLHSVNSVLPMSRDFLSYQEFCIAGMLVALHLDQVLDFVGRRWRQILMVTAVVGTLTVLWYMASVWSGNSVERASDIYEPASVLWCFAAIAGMLSISWWWDQRTPATHRARSLSWPASLAGIDRMRLLRPHPLHQHHPLPPRCDGVENEPSLVGHRRHSLCWHGDRDVLVRLTDPPDAAPLGARRAGPGGTARLVQQQAGHAGDPRESGVRQCRAHSRLGQARRPSLACGGPDTQARGTRR